MAASLLVKEPSLIQYDGELLDYMIKERQLISTRQNPINTWSYEILFRVISVCGHYFLQTGLYTSVFHICSLGKLLFRIPAFVGCSVF